MANPAVFVQHFPNFGRLCFVAAGAKVRIGGVEHTADGEPVTRSYEGAENLPAMEAFATKNMGSPQSLKSIAPGIYSVEPRQTAIEALTGTSDSPAKGRKGSAA